MKYKSVYIIQWTLVLLVLLLILPFNIAQIVYQGTTTKLNVFPVKGNEYKWELYKDSTLNFAQEQGDCPPTEARFLGRNTGPEVNIKWISGGIYFYKVAVQDATRCTNNIRIGKIKVISSNLRAVITGNTQIGACQHVILDASGSAGDPVTYLWTSLDPGISLSSVNSVNTVLEVSPSFKGPYPAKCRISLLITNKANETNSQIIVLTIMAPPVANIFSTNKPENDGSLIFNGASSSGENLTYRWSTAEGKIIGADDQAFVRIIGNGNYRLEITDGYGCKSVKDFNFPIELYRIKANPDVAITSWGEEIILNVLSNDFATAPLLPQSMKIKRSPAHGNAKIYSDGTISYTSLGKESLQDQFEYEICDAVGLCSSATVSVMIKNEEVILIQGFSPNGDGINDLLEFRGLDNYSQSAIYIYNRSGQLIFKSSDYKNEWDGTISNGDIAEGTKVPAGVYYYVLEPGGTNRTIRGYLYIGY